MLLRYYHTITENQLQTNYLSIGESFIKIGSVVKGHGIVDTLYECLNNNIMQMK